MGQDTEPQSAPPVDAVATPPTASEGLSTSQPAAATEQATAPKIVDKVMQLRATSPNHDLYEEIDHTLDKVPHPGMRPREELSRQFDGLIKSLRKDIYKKLLPEDAAKKVQPGQNEQYSSRTIKLPDGTKYDVSHKGHISQGGGWNESVTIRKTNEAGETLAFASFEEQINPVGGLRRLFAHSEKEEKRAVRIECYDGTGDLDDDRVYNTKSRGLVEFEKPRPSKRAPLPDLLGDYDSLATMQNLVTAVIEAKETYQQIGPVGPPA